MTKVIENEVRGTALRLVGYTRALALCARMNRETEVLDFIDDIGAGEVLYDLGACEGRFALYAALRGVRCYAFEPEARNFHALTENLALNGARAVAHLTPLPYAVGATNHVTALRIAQPWAGGHHRVLAGAARVDLALEFTSAQEVEVVALDDFITARGIAPPAYLKVDVDGSELPFVRGARATLSRAGLKGVMFELQTADRVYAELLRTMRACGFVEFSRHEIEPQLFNVWFKRPANSGEPQPPACVATT